MLRIVRWFLFVLKHARVSASVKSPPNLLASLAFTLPPLERPLSAASALLAPCGAPCGLLYAALRETLLSGPVSE